ncbi:MAG: VIT and VWA domain-containing protein [Planctomycetota bacterium]
MNRIKTLFLLGAIGALTLQVTAAPPGAERKLQTEEVEPGPVAGRLSLKSHRVKVVINNGFAETKITQTLTNTTAATVEATWSFPMPQKAALSELSYTIDQKTHIGEVVAKEKARRIYREERDGGRQAALAEQDRFYEYRVSLARVPAGGTVDVTVLYYQALEIDGGIGRYLYPLTPGNTKETMNSSFWTMDKVAGRLEIGVTLKTSFPVDALHSPSHPGVQAQQGESAWTARFEQPNAALDRDFVLLYRLDKNVPARVELLTNREGKGEGTFMAVVTPGSDLAPVKNGTDWMFVLDISGSMQGEKIRVLREGVGTAIEGLGAKDRVQVILFNNTSRALTTRWVNATGFQELANRVRKIESGGGTNIFGALDAAYRCADDDRPAAIVLVSDGVANAGPHHYRDFINQVRGHDMRLFTFIMGNSANRPLLEDLAVLSGGFAKAVSVHDEIGAHLLLARDRMFHEAMHDVTFELDGATVIHPKRLPNLYVGQQLVVFGRYNKPGATRLKVSARISGKKQTWDLPVTLPAAEDGNPEIERLYALSAIGDIQREAWLQEKSDVEKAQAVTDIALAYSLVTDYTSMVVVGPDRKNHYGIGDANAKRRARERRAAANRTQRGNTALTHTQHQPLAGRTAAHAPSRRNRGGGSYNGGGGSGGGGSGGGAIGPLGLLPFAGLALVAARRRRRR